MIKKITFFLGGLVGCVLAVTVPLFLVKTTQFKKMGAAAASMVPPATTVTAAAAVQQTWESRISATGSIAAVQGVTVAAEVPGKVVRIAFEPGMAVNAGDLLVQLDVSTEEAQLRAAEATAALARANLQRARDLRENNTNAPAELDAADAQAKQAAAQADAIRSVIAKKSIRAPFSGRLGLRLVNLGQIMRDGDAVSTLQTLDPIYVNFSLPQQRLALLRPGGEIRVTTDAAPAVSFEGKINAINPEVDATTRNVRVQGTIQNRNEQLRAGMYANVEVILPTPQTVLAIPATSVLYAPFGDSVFVIEEQKDEKSGAKRQVLRQQFVRLGASRGDFVSVTAGLKPGEQVVTSGVFKLRPGMPVQIDNTMAPPAQLAPKPGNA